MIDEYGRDLDSADVKNSIRGALLAGTQVGPAWTAMLVPRGQDEQGNAHWQLPGAITGLYSAAGTYGPMAGDWLARQAGFKTNLPQAPGTETATKSFEDSVRYAEANVPHVQAQNEEEQHVADLGFGAASTALPLGGPLKGLVSGAPAVVRGLAHFAYPTAGAGGEGLAAGAVMTAGMSSYEEAQRDKLLRDAGLDPAQVKQYRETGTMPDLTQPDTTQQVAHPETGAPATVPFHTGSVTTPATPDTSEKYDTLAMFGRPDIKIVTPDFNTTGETGWTWANTLGYGALGVAGTALALRYGGKVLDPAIKTIMQQGDQINTAGNVARFNANLDAIDRGQVLGHATASPSGAVRGEAPLPGNAGTVGTNLAQAAWDKTRVLTEFAKVNAPDSGVAKQLEAEIGTINHSTPLHNAIAEQMATGVNKANGSSVIPKWKSTLQDYDALDATQQAKVESTVYAGDELDTRKIKFDRASQANQAINDDAMFRQNFRNTHSDDLRQAYRDGMADPAVANVVNQMYGLQTANMREAFSMGRITQGRLNEFLTQRPRNIPTTNLEGIVDKVIPERDLSTVGWDTPPTRTVDAITQHYARLYEELQQNRLTDKMMQQAVIAQNANPTGRARVISEITDARGRPVDSAEGRTITTYRDGIAHTWSIDNSNLHRAFKGNIAQTRMFLNTADSLRRSYQSGTTGVMGTIVAQRPFSFISLNRNIPQIATDRTPGRHFGIVDRMMQSTTGGRIGYRGPDPSHWIGSYWEATKGSGAVTARAMADALRRSGNPVTASLRALKGDAWVKAWADSLEQHWLTTNAAARRAEGASGAGSSGIYERPTYNIARGTHVGYSPMADIVPGVFHPDGIAIPYTRVRIPGTKGTTTAWINMRTWLRDIHQEISDGANSYYWKGMKADPSITPEQRVFETRRVLGDPSMHGASTTAQNLSHLVPWINPSIQDAVRMMRNLRDNPVAFTLGTVHTLGMTAAGSLLSAMLGGNRHLNMLGRLMSTHDRAANATFFHDPDNEHNYTQISLPQRWRMIYPLILQAVSDGIGAMNLHQGEDAYNRIVHSLADLFSQHVTHSTVVSAREGLQDFAGILQPPPAVQALAAVAGSQINEPIAQVIKNVGEGQRPFGGMIQNMDKAGRLPGQAANSSYVSNDDANWVHNVMRSIFGIAGDAYTHATNFGSRLALTHDVADAFSGLLTDAGQSWRDNAPFGNMVWGNNVKMTTRNPIEESNRMAWDKMQAMPKQADIGLAGLTRRGGVPVGVSGQPKINADPRIIQMVTTVNNYTGRINRTVEPQINDLRKQIADLNNDPYYPAKDKRNQLNLLVGKKNELESQKNLEIEKLNAQLSALAGGKHVNVGTFDPQRGMDQFHD